MIKFAQIIKSNGQVLELIPQAKEFSLDELRTIVGGYIQIVPSVRPDWFLVINEEGRLAGLPLNEKASLLYVNGIDDPIVGDVALIHQSQISLKP